MKFENKTLLLIGGAVTILSAFSAVAADLTDGQIAEIVMTANKEEISDANIARSITENKDVKGFAQHMIDEHSKNEKTESKLTEKDRIKPIENEVAQTLKRDAEAKLADLKQLRGAEFDKAYIELQIEMHQQLLTALDQKLIPAAQNTDFKGYLEETKKHVKKHLELAKKLQTAMP